MVVDACRSGNLRDVVLGLLRDLRVGHGYGYFAGTRIDVRDGFHRQMEHYAFARVLGVLRDFRRIVHVRQHGERHRYRKLQKSAFGLKPLPAIVDDYRYAHRTGAGRLR